MSVMESLEKRFRVLKWQARCAQGIVDSSEDAHSASPEIAKPFFNQCSEVTLDRTTGRYYLQRSGTYNCVRGAAPFISSLEQQSFDGETYRKVQWEKHGKTRPTPQDAVGFGTIRRNKDHLSAPGTSVVEQGTLVLGLAYMPPYCFALGTSYPLQPLSSLIQTWLFEGKDVVVTEDDAGVWTISVEVSVGGCGGGECSSPSYEGLLRIAYDRAKGGVVTGVRLLGTDEAGEFNFDNVRVEIDVQDVGGGFWAPKTIKNVYPWDSMMELTSYDAVEINPPVSADMFRFEFPKGVHVTDYVNEMFYIKGSDIDRQSAHEAFLHRMGRAMSQST